ncbi:MAG: peptidoglycan recognition protein family protein [Desulfobacterales bacterium]|nr:peptidoglycan recognition protein family protein [Desulfobacterales bacterium]
MKPVRIILHHSLTRDSETVSWGAIRDYHVNVNGWSNIGYHFGIENLRGQTEVLLGRFPDRSGAHCRGNNQDSIGICFVGNFDIQQPPEESWNAGIKLCRYLMKTYNIQTIQGHRELDSGKSCPGRMFSLDKFRTECKLSF